MHIERLPQPGENNLWFRYNESDAVLVFLHGVLSDSRGCWFYESKNHPERNCYWPELIESDPRFNDISIYLAGYYTAPDSGAYEIQNCADEVLAALKRKGVDGHPPVMEKAKITFVCHSMGGIVARYLLEANHQEFNNKSVGLVLIASPSYGSKLANSLDTLMGFFNHQQGVQLKWGAWSLKNLDDRFRELKEKKRIANLSGIELYENHFIVHRKWLPIFTRKLVVTKESAGRYFGAARPIPKTDHFSICKPAKKTDLVHEYLYDFLSQSELLPSEVGSSDFVRIPAESAPDVSRPPAPVVQPPPHEAPLPPESFTFIKLIDIGIELLREGERRKKLFFEEVVKPIQALSQKMYDDHIKTFADTRTILLSEKSKSRDIVSLVEGRLLFEHGTTELLYRLTGTEGNIGIRMGSLGGSLKDDFDEYVSDIAKCLISPNHEIDHRGIVYYVALSDVIRRLSEEKLTKQTREEALRDLEEIVRRFQSFYADVVSKYLELQRYCLA